ncbi:MAG TPA: hypothetical protein VMB18_03435 [Terriglobales bacterium]|nr:hypothetical protein [Terriglobales bacterium]
MPPFFVVAPFSQEKLFEALDCECAVAEVSANRRAAYLSDYLREIGARTIVIENEYVDGDYLDDYASFYAKCFEKYPKTCKRIHFFATEVTNDDFKNIILNKADSGVVQRFAEGYLGFVVARPLPRAIIGRTVLKTYPPASGRRNYPCTKRYRVSLFGLGLEIDSLAYQEQDRALAACATVALWACFQRDRDLFQSLAPTPATITRSANRVLEDSRPFPSHGLKVEQVCNAIAAVGLEPEVIEVKPGIPLVSLLYGYLKLGAPVLLVVRIASNGRHALTLAGFSLNPSSVLSSEGASPSAGIPLVGQRIDEFYAHDDQVGPFSRLKVIPPAAPDGIVKFTGGWPNELIPEVVIIPLYAKIRLAYLEVLPWLKRLGELITIASLPGTFEWDLSLMTSNDFKEKARTGEIGVPQERLEKLLVEGHPRYIWRAILMRNAIPLVEFLVDTTAMTQSFPINQLWWHDNILKATIGQLLQVSLVEDPLKQLLTVRFFEFLRSTV